MNLKEYGLEKVHKRLLRTLIVFDEICRENDIKYSLHGGTLLGAVRSRGFIPWDDDIDISMTRLEFNKLKKIYKNNKRKDYDLNQINTWLPRFVSYEDNEIVFIDIFIWDYISENKIVQKVKIFFLRFLQGMMKKNNIYSNYGIKKKILVGIPYVFGKIFSMKTKIALFERIEIFFGIGNKIYIHRSNDGFKGVAEIYDKNFMNKYEEIEFEGYMFMVNQRYKEFLVRSYGKDYILPPPENERIPQHTIQREKFD